MGSATGRNAVTLSQARAKARELHAMVHEGRDPLAERQTEKARAAADAAKVKVAAITFAEVADMYLAAHEAAWSQKHYQQWRSTLRDYVLPVIGDMPVGSVDTSDVMRILEPLWRAKTVTAVRVRARIEAVCDYARARGWRASANPALWHSHLDQLLPAGSKLQRVAHHAALPWRELGAFMQRLRQNSSISALSLEFLVLTATRSAEARGARWAEVDLVHAVWTIAAERTKAGRAHRVPLSPAAMDVLRTMAQLGTSGYVFPGLRAAATLSDRSLSRVMHGAGGQGATVHGFRSTFRDWVGETTNYPRELAEAALAHTFTAKVEAAYQRGDLLERRRQLMNAWAEFCSKPMVAGDVVPLHAVR